MSDVIAVDSDRFVVVSQPITGAFMVLLPWAGACVTVAPDETSLSLLLRRYSEYPKLCDLFTTLHLNLRQEDCS